jgi:hypothetical protein
MLYRNHFTEPRRQTPRKQRPKAPEPQTVRRIAKANNGTQQTYWLYTDGLVWLCEIRRLSNCGTLAEFMDAVSNGHFRVELDPQPTA